MFANNAFSQFVSDNGNFVNSMDPDGNNILGVDSDVEDEEYVDLQRNTQLIEENKKYIEEAIHLDKYLTNEEICQVALEVMKEQKEKYGGHLLTETSLTDEAREALDMSNVATAKKYNKHVKDFGDYMVNEGGAGLIDDVTVCNYMAFLAKNRYEQGTLWTVYTALNRFSMITSNFPLSRHMKLKLIMKKYTKNFVTKKAFTLSSNKVVRLLDNKGLLKDTNFKHLELKVGMIITLYGLLQCNEIIQVKMKDVMVGLSKSMKEE